MRTVSMKEFRGGGMNNEYGGGGRMPKQLLEYFKRKRREYAMGGAYREYQDSGKTLSPLQEILYDRMSALGSSELGKHQGERYLDVELSKHLRPEDRERVLSEMKESGLPRRIYGGERGYGSLMQDFETGPYGQLGSQIYDADVARYEEAQRMGQELPKYGLNYGEGMAVSAMQGDPSTDAFSMLTKDITNDPRFAKLSEQEQRDLYDLLGRQADRFGAGEVDFSKFSR